LTSRHTIKQLNEPQPIEVKAGADGAPLRIRLKALGSEKRARKKVRPASVSHEFQAIRTDGQWMSVLKVNDRWKINDEWWRGEELEIERIYFDVLLESNQRVTIFHDLIRDTWARQAE